MRHAITFTLSIFILFLTSFVTPSLPAVEKNDTDIEDVAPAPKTLYTWEQLIERIKKREGLMLEPYHCAGGYLTIGYGHLITKRDSALLDGITEAQADSLLRKDLAYSRNWVEKNLNLEGTQLMAITNFCFAFGNTKLFRSTLYKKLKQENAPNKEINKEIMRWVNINGRPSNYLKKERKFEVWLFNLTAESKKQLN